MAALKWLGDAVALLTSEPPLWRAWDWSRLAGPGASRCRWATLAPSPTLGLRPPWNGSVCVRPPGDLLSDALASEGRWAECDDMPRLYAIAAAVEPGIIVDIGANLGACTLHLLFATDATVERLLPAAPRPHPLRPPARPPRTDRRTDRA